MSGMRQTKGCLLAERNLEAEMKEGLLEAEMEEIQEEGEEEDLSLSERELEGALDYEDFFREFLGRTPLLSPEEEKRLSRRILENNDKEAFDRFVTANLRLVVACARKLRKKYGCQSFLTFMDLVQEGILGLMTAVARFDYRKNTRFSTYGIPWIYQRMRVAYLQHRWGFSVPGYAGISAQIHSNEIRAFHDGKKGLTEDAVRAERIRELARISQNVVSIDSWADSDCGTAFRVDPEKQDLGEMSVSFSQTAAQEGASGEVESRILKESVLEALRNELSQTEYEILSRRFGLGEYRSPRTLADIAAEYGKSSEFARSVLNRALNRLRGNRSLEALGKAWEILHPGAGNGFHTGGVAEQ
jgi:RNA polymerase primary sigma factor